MNSAKELLIELGECTVSGNVEQRLVKLSIEPPVCALLVALEVLDHLLMQGAKGLKIAFLRGLADQFARQRLKRAEDREEFVDLLLGDKCDNGAPVRDELNKAFGGKRFQ